MAGGPAPVSPCLTASQGSRFEAGQVCALLPYESVGHARPRHTPHTSNSSPAATRGRALPHPRSHGAGARAVPVPRALRHAARGLPLARRRPAARADRHRAVPACGRVRGAAGRASGVPLPRHRTPEHAGQPVQGAAAAQAALCHLRVPARGDLRALQQGWQLGSTHVTVRQYLPVLQSSHPSMTQNMYARLRTHDLAATSVWGW